MGNKQRKINFSKQSVSVSKVSSDDELVGSIKHHAVITVMDELVQSRLYKQRFYQKSSQSSCNSEDISSVHSVMSNGSSQMNAGYKTRGVSEDIYDNNSEMCATKGYATHLHVDCDDILHEANENDEEVEDMYDDDNDLYDSGERLRSSTST